MTAEHRSAPAGPPLRVGVAGAGATGGYLATALAGGHVEVTVLARGETATTVAREGLTVEGPDGSLLASRPRVVTATSPVDPVDVVLFCVKTYDTEQAADDVAGLLGGDGVVVCLQNGIANEDALAARYGAERVYAGVLYVGAERVAADRIRRHTPARVVLGPYEHGARELHPSVAALVTALHEADVAVTVDADVLAAKWQKFLFNCGLNPLTALTGRRLGAIRATERGRALFTTLVDEAARVAQASGVTLAPDVRDRVTAVADRMDISSSMAEDRAAGRRLELDAFSGHVLRLARRHGIDTPVTATVHALLEVVDAR